MPEPMQLRRRRAAVLSAAGLLGALWAGGAFAAGAAARAGGRGRRKAQCVQCHRAGLQEQDTAFPGPRLSWSRGLVARGPCSCPSSCLAARAVGTASAPPRPANSARREDNRIANIPQREGKRAVVCCAAGRIATERQFLPLAAPAAPPTPVPSARAAAPVPELAAHLAPNSVQEAVPVLAVPAPAVTPARAPRAGGAARLVGGRRFSRARARASRSARGARCSRRAAGARLAPRQEVEPVAVPYDPSRVRVQVQLGLRVLQGPQIPSARQARALSASGLSNTAGELVSTDFYIDFGH
ncbi:unnamed protein product [Prorocentrum cordatum]|uniref:Cytochrome c domain-containing protein n=1 Tax=Prorocentrum cordatum TaxID=2364126 RepID=A0ABN9TDU1_9DINO|nr:unnamed protein product [Polarella glacialis]